MGTPFAAAFGGGSHGWAIRRILKQFGVLSRINLGLWLCGGMLFVLAQP
jgi:hypothetical protein